MTVAEHIEVSNHIKRAWLAGQFVRRHEPHNSRVYRAALRLEQELSTLKCELDTEVFALVEGRDPRNMATRVYYGGLFVPQPSTDPRDAFDGWRQDEVVL